MGCFEAEEGCCCYEFCIIPSYTKYEYNINHTYHIKMTVDNLTSINLPSLLEFDKQINMQTAVEHTLECYAVVYRGGIDEFLTTLPPFEDEGRQLIPWAAGKGFTGSYENLYLTVYNNGEPLTTVKLNSTWHASYSDTMTIKEGVLNLANIKDNFFHVNANETKYTAKNLKTDQPVGWTLVPSGASLTSRWIDFVGMQFQYGIESSTTESAYIDTINKSSQNRLADTLTQTFSVVGYPFPVYSYMEGNGFEWEPVNAIPYDLEWDGWQMGWFHTVTSFLPTRYRLLRDEIFNVIMGDNKYISINTLLQSVGFEANWQGSIAGSRLLGATDETWYKYIVYTDTKETNTYKTQFENNAKNTTQLILPKGLQPKCYPICPI